MAAVNAGDLFSQLLNLLVANLNLLRPIALRLLANFCSATPVFGWTPIIPLTTSL
jgi:hypothetical protein